MGILLGLVTALTWGGADFVARFSTHRIGTLRTMFYMQFTGFLLLTVSMRWFGGWGHLADGSGWQPWAWGLLAGLLNACATLSLYRSFEIGKMAVVAPLSASYPALTLTLSWLSGDHLSPARSVGVALILFDVAVISVLGSLYGAVTVGLAAIFLREHISRWQWAGIATIFGGIVLIST